MRRDAARRPEGGKKEVEEAEQVGDAGAQGHQCIHVRGTVAQLAPCPGEKTAAEPEDEGRGEQPRHPRRPCTVHEEHPDDEQRHGQRQCGRDAAFQRPVAGVVLALGLSGGIRQIDHQIVPRVADRLSQLFGSGRSRVVLHGDSRCGVVHRSAPDSRLLAERPSHTAGARSAAHAEHGKNTFCHGFVRCHDSVFFVGTKITRPPGGHVTKFGISFTRFGQNGPNGPRKIRRTEWSRPARPGRQPRQKSRREGRGRNVPRSGEERSSENGPYGGRAETAAPAGPYGTERSGGGHPQKVRDTFGHTRSSGRRTAVFCCRKRLGVIPVTLLNCALR